MSGTAAPSIALIQVQSGPSIALFQGSVVPVIPPDSANPLSADPGQNWTLASGGWEQLVTNPLYGRILTECGGVILLEDGAGAMLMEL